MKQSNQVTGKWEVQLTEMGALRLGGWFVQKMIDSIWKSEAC